MFSLPDIPCKILLDLTQIQVRKSCNKVGTIRHYYTYIYYYLHMDQTIPTPIPNLNDRTICCYWPNSTFLNKSEIV